MFVSDATSVLRLVSDATSVLRLRKSYNVFLLEDPENLITFYWLG